MTALRAPLAFDAIAPVYDETRGLPAELDARLVELLTQYLRDRSVLDVGVGTGRFGSRLAAAGVRLVGVDLSRPMLERARARGLRRLVHGDARRLPFPTHAFDVATSQHLLHLIPDWTSAVAEFARLATTEYLVVVERTVDSPDLGAAYRERLARAGVRWPLGIYERDLEEALPPDTVVDAGRAEVGVPLAREFEFLDRRVFGCQQIGPPGIHEAIVADLRRSFDERGEGHRTVHARILAWRSERLSRWVAGGFRGLVTPHRPRG